MMRQSFGFVLVLAFLGAVSNSASAALIQYGFGNEITGTGESLSGRVLVRIDDGGTPGTVDVSIDTTLLDGSLSESIRTLFLNFNPNLDATTLVTNRPPEVNSVARSNNGSQVGRDLFDIRVDWASGGLKAGAVHTIGFARAGLTAADFDFPSAQFAFGSAPYRGMLGALSAENLGSNGQGTGTFEVNTTFNSPGGPVVPEPSSAIVFGMVGLAVLGLRRQSVRASFGRGEDAN